MVEQADGLFNLEYNQNNGDDYDAFYQGNKTAFGYNTIPSSKWWDGTGSGLEITDIRGTGSNMTFKEPFKVIDSSPLNPASNY